MRKSLFGMFLAALGVAMGYAVVTRCVEETRDFR